MKILHLFLKNTYCLPETRYSYILGSVMKILYLLLKKTYFLPETRSRFLKRPKFLKVLTQQIFFSLKFCACVLLSNFHKKVLRKL